MKTLNHWKSLSLLTLTAMLLGGCATPSTVMTREQERPAAYAALSPEMRSLVDQGKITRGMNMDDVYIAWGRPSQVTSGENDSGQSTTWSYYGSYLQESAIWGWRRVYYNYYPVNYISAQVTFTNGVVKQWQTFAPPGY